MNCEDVPSGEDWGDVTDEKREALEAAFYTPSEVQTIKESFASFSKKF